MFKGAFSKFVFTPETGGPATRCVDHALIPAAKADGIVAAELVQLFDVGKAAISLMETVVGAGEIPASREAPEREMIPRPVNTHEQQLTRASSGANT